MNVASGATTVSKGIHTSIKKHQKLRSDMSNDENTTPSAAVPNPETHSTGIQIDLSQSEALIKGVDNCIEPESGTSEIIPTSSIEKAIAGSVSPPQYKGPNHFLSLPNELLAQIIVEIRNLGPNVKINPYSIHDKARQKERAAWELRGELREPLLNFGLTCWRNLEMVLPELYREIELHFPLDHKSKGVEKVKHMEEKGYLVRDFTFRFQTETETERRPPPSQIFKLVPNITKLKLNFRYTTADQVLHLTESALQTCITLKDLTITGRAPAKWKPPKPYMETHSFPIAPLESIKITFFDRGSPLLITNLAKLLKNSCAKVKKLVFKPFTHLDCLPEEVDWEKIGYAMKSEKLEDLRLHVPSDHALRYMGFLESLPACKRDKVKIIHLVLAETHLKMADLSDVVTRELLRFQSLVSIRITYIQFGDSAMRAEKKQSEDPAKAMFATLAKELKSLRSLKCHESAFGSHVTWCWDREDGQDWHENNLVKYPRS